MRLNRYWKWASAGVALLMLATLAVTVLPHVHLAQAAGPSYCPTSTTSASDCISTTSGTGIFLSSSGTLYASQAAQLTLKVSTTSNVNCFAVNATTVEPNPKHFNQVSKSSFSFTVLPGSGNGTQNLTAATYLDQGNTDCATLVATSSPSAQYVLDNAGPTVTPSVAPTPNGAGWDKANVTVTLAASDSGSGVKSTTYTLNGGSSQTYSGGISVNSEGTNTLNYTATDNVGNVTTGTVTVKLDKTNPTISGSRTPAANGAGWNNTSVNVSFTCADPNGGNGTTGSGIATCVGSSAVTTQGFNQSVTGTATDVANNSASATVGNINIDETPPTLAGTVTTASSGTDASSNLWYNGPVTVQWACADPNLPGGHAGSGVVSCPTNSIISSEGMGKTTSATIFDNAGNMTTNSSPPVNIDTHAPTTSIVSPISIPNWTNHTLTLSLQASDNLSGVANTFYTLDGGAMQSGTTIAVAGEGSHTVQFWSEDYAGNFETAHSVTINIDETAPTITHAQSPLANGAGWNNSDVTVTFTCADPTNASNGTAGSGVKSCDGVLGITGSTPDTTEGTTPVTGTAVDNAGNSASDTDTVNLDKTDPTINGATDRAANVHGWYNAPVTVTFTCADPTNASNGTPGSGIAASGGCTAPMTLSGDGANQHANGSAADLAGNSASTSVSGINIDQTAPVLTGAPTTAANGNGWYKSPVTIHWTCSDALSGIDGSCPAESTISGEGANLTASASVSDLAGNMTTATSPAVNVDTTAPVTTVAHLTSADYTATSGTLWYKGDVSIDLSATDNLSGVAATYMSVDGSPAVAATSATVSGQGGHTVTFWSVDKAGNVEDRTTTGHSVSFNIDMTVPTISGARAPLANNNGWNNGPVTVTFSCADAESGLASCTNPITLSGEGFNQQATGTAADNVGNTSNVTVGSINIDLTPPTLTGAPTTSANGASWYNGDVVIKWSCADPLLGDGNPGSGIASCPANSTITGEGTGLKATASATDQAGNTASANSAAVNIDRTAPNITGAITTASSGTDALSNPWYNTDVKVAWTCSDPKLADGSDGSGVASCPGNSTITGEGAGLTTSATAADRADNSIIGTSPAVNIDRTPPNTIVTAPSGWNNTDVTVNLNASDALSGVKATHFSLDGGADQTGSSLTINSEGDHTLTFYSEDYAGNKEAAKTVHVLIDKTAPTISDTHSPLPNSAGWNNSDVTVTFTCADALSGVATCDGIAGTTGSTNVSAEGGDQDVTGTAVDNASNTATDHTTVSIDKTAPTIHGATDRAANADNWYNAPVTVTFTCADLANASNGTNGSGIAHCDPPVILSSDGRDESASGSATDAAGNSASTTVNGINLDQVAPTITGAPTTPANSAGWYNGDVTIKWTCSDAKLADGSDGSGVISCPGDSTVTGEGTNLGAAASASDHANNIGNGSVNGIHIDRTAPATTASAPAADYTNGAGMAYYGKAVTMTLTGTDNLSGVAHTYYTVDGGAQQTYGAAFTIAAEGTHTLTFWSVDNAGNVEDKTAAANTITFRIDLTGPTVNTSRTPANGHGWNNGPVTVTFSCVDPALSDTTAGSGLASCSSPVTLTGEGAGQSVSGTAADNVGNTTPATVSNIDIDLTKPTLSGAPTTAPDGFGWYNGDVTIHWTATDALSGVDPATTPADSTITGEGAGLKAHASVSDLAGNTASADSAPVNIDHTAPTLAGSISTVSSGTDNYGTAWYNGDVAVGWSACDALSGVDPASVPSSSTLNGSCFGWTDTVTGEGSNQSSNETASDKAGNPANNAVTDIHIDRTPPATTLSAAPPDWSNSDVTLTLNATDNLSGVATTFYTVDGSGQQNGTTIQVTGEGTHTITFWSVDYAGNSEATHTVMVKIDKTAPTITHTQSPLANDAGWNNGDVTVTFTCADPNLSDGTAGSGVKTCDGVAGPTGATAVSTEGPNQAVSGIAVDNAGNSATDTAIINLDKTKPTISGAPDRPANAHGWYNADVTVTFTCNDPNGGNGTQGSGIANCPAPTTLGEGANQSVSGSAADKAGNSASATVSGINLDKTAPNLSGAITTASSGTDAHGNIWYNSDVTVHWSCSDALSGIDGACPSDSTVGPAGGQGTNLSATQTVSDLAGNTTTATVGGINIDRVAPTTATALQSAASAYGNWFGGKVTVTLTASDNLSGVASTYYTVDGGAAQSYSGAFAVDGDGVHTITFWSRDYAGNSEAAHSQTIQIDEAAPTITGAPTTSPNGNGWYNTTVTVKFTCSDAESGVATCDSVPGSTGTTTLSTDGANQPVTGTAYDNVGHSASATVSGINIDRTLPVVTVTIGSTSFTEGGGPNTTPSTFTHTIANPYTLGNAPSLGCAATDATSGFGGVGNACTGVLTGGMSNGVGTFTYTATATDLAGNTTKVAVTFVVAYNFSGFLQPVNYTAHQIGASSSTFKGGSTVPVKFQLRLANGTVVQAGAVPLWVDPLNAGPNSSSPSASAGSAAATFTNGGTFRWDPTGQQYIYTWNTASTQAGSWWRVGVKLDDGQTYFVYISLRS